MLGNRLASSDNYPLREQSQICYICSGNLNKMVESSNADIQEVVELVVIMQKALEVQGIKDVQIEGRIANVLSQYAEMLAEEGDLEAALNYLGNSRDERIVMLKDRLCRALGYIEESKAVPKAPGMQNYYDQTRRPMQTVQHPLPAAASAQGRPYFEPNVAPTKQFIVPPPNQFNAQQQQQQQQQPFGLTSHQPSMQYDQPPHSYTPTSISQPPPPPPPTSASSGVGSRPSSVGPQARSKYIIDPSVKSTSSYGQVGFPQQTSMYNNQQIPPLPSYPTQNMYQSHAPGSTNPTYPGQGFPPNPKEAEPFNPIQPNILPPLPNQPQSQMYDPVRTQPHPQTQMYGVDNEPPVDRSNIYQLPPQAAGWNDPPAAKPSRLQVSIFIFYLSYRSSVFSIKIIVISEQ